MKTLETTRLILRPWKLTDVDDFYEYAKDEDVGPNAGWPPHKSKDYTLKVIKSYIAQGNVYALVYKENNKVIGSIGFHMDKKRMNYDARMIGYALSKDYWGQGLMTEGVKAVINYLFTYEELDVISCYHYPKNIRSKRVIEKCGFIYEGTLRCSRKLINGNFVDDVCYSITREEWSNKQ